MEKTKNSVKRMLKKQYEKACNGYLCELLRMWELDMYYGYWDFDKAVRRIKAEQAQLTIF